jgi:hypothetical protein
MSQAVIRNWPAVLVVVSCLQPLSSSLSWGRPLHQGTGMNVGAMGVLMPIF